MTNQSATSWQQVVVMEFGKQHNRHNGLLPVPTCCRLVADLLRGIWCNGFWPFTHIINERNTSVLWIRNLHRIDGDHSRSFKMLSLTNIMLMLYTLIQPSCRAFDYAGPTVWNSLPDELRNSDSFDSFKRFMKTILFSRYQCSQHIRGYFYNEMRYINLRFTYLLTSMGTRRPNFFGRIVHCLFLLFLSLVCFFNFFTTSMDLLCLK